MLLPYLQARKEKWDYQAPLVTMERQAMKESQA